MLLDAHFVILKRRRGPGRGTPRGAPTAGGLPPADTEGRTIAPSIAQVKRFVYIFFKKTKMTGGRAGERE